MKRKAISILLSTAMLAQVVTPSISVLAEGNNSGIESVVNNENEENSDETTKEESEQVENEVDQEQTESEEETTGNEEQVEGDSNVSEENKEDTTTNSDSTNGESIEGVIPEIIVDNEETVDQAGSEEKAVRMDTAVYTDASKTQMLKNPNEHVYAKEVALHFTGTATLNGKNIASGTKVTTAGVHTVTVTNGDNTDTYGFSIIDNINGREIVSISNGYYHSVALDSEGTLYGWGSNRWSELGNETGWYNKTPAKLNGNGAISESTKIVSVSAGGYHTVALDSEGNLYTWGYNNYGQLGDGTKTDKSTPIKINGNGAISESTKIVSVSASGHGTTAVDSEGNLYAWGNNEAGQLGDGTKEEKTTPVKINGNGAISESTKIVSVMIVNGPSYITTDASASAIDSEGNLYTWGDNSWGQLGDGTNYAKITPIKINGNGDIPESAKIVSIENGRGHLSAIDSEGNLYTWGYNYIGQLGDGTKEAKNTPVKINGNGDIPESAKIVSANLGEYDTSAIDSEGNLYTWGHNNYGQLGNLSATTKTTPGKINGNGDIPESAKIVSVDMGQYIHTSAIDSEGNIYTWGRNNSGQLGNGILYDGSTYTPTETSLSLDLETSTSSDSDNSYIDVKVPNGYTGRTQIAYSIDGGTTNQYTSTIDGNKTVRITIPNKVDGQVNPYLGNIFTLNLAMDNTVNENINNVVAVSFAPQINGVEDTEIYAYSSFDPLEGISAIDAKDGDLTSEITVEGKVNTSKEGTYKLIYTVKNSKGDITTAERTVVVKHKELVAGLNAAKGGIMLSTAGNGLRFFATIDGADSKEIATYYITTASSDQEAPKFEVKSTVDKSDYSQIKTSIEFSELAKLDVDAGTELYVKRVVKGQENRYIKLLSGDVELTNAFNISNGSIAVSTTKSENGAISLTKTLVDNNSFVQGVSNISWNSTGLVVEGTPTNNGTSEGFNNSKVSMLLKDSNGNYIKEEGTDINLEVRGMYRDGKYKVTVPYEVLANAKTFELRLIGNNVQRLDVLTNGTVEDLKTGINGDYSYNLSADENGVVNLSVERVENVTGELTTSIITTDKDTAIKQFSIRGVASLPGIDKIGSSVRYTIIAKKGDTVVYEQLATRLNDNGNYNGFKTNLSLSKLIALNLEKNEEISLSVKVEYLGTTVNLDLTSSIEAVSATDKESKETFEMSSKEGKAVITKK